MIDAALYLTVRWTTNALRRRLARLREPKYLIGFAVGLLYFYWLFFRPRMGGGAHGGGSPFGTAGFSPSVELLGVLLLGLLLALSWLFGSSQNPLPFAQAETQFLFTAPLTRRQVIHFKLIRSQLALLVSAALSVLIFSGGRLSTARVTQSLGLWLLFATVQLHFAATAFVRANLAQHGVTGLKRRMAVIGLGAGLAGFGVWSVREALPELAAAFRGGPDSGFAALAALADYGLLGVMLWPLRALVRPVVASGFGDFVTAMPAALAVLAAHYVWVVRSAVAFEEVAAEAAEQTARKIEAMRRGGLTAARVSGGKLRRPLYPLAPVGSPAAAFFWKNVLAVTRQIGMRLLVIVAVGFAVIIYVARFSETEVRQLEMLGYLLLAVAFVVTVLGPYGLRQDLREDLRLLDVLKAYPVRGREIVAGEVLAPAVALAAATWACLIGGFLALLDTGADIFPIGTRLSLLLTALALAPGVQLLLVLTQNAGALLFPAWVTFGREHPAGLERTGQQILVMLGSLFVLAVAMIPAGIAGGVIGMLLAGSLGTWASVPAALVGAGMIGFESYLAIYYLGELFERTDPTTAGIV